MASTSLASVGDIRAFIDEYFQAWSGTDEDRILSYYAEAVSLEIPGFAMNGKAAVRDQFVRPFIAGFPGEPPRYEKLIFGEAASWWSGPSKPITGGPSLAVLQPARP